MTELQCQSVSGGYQEVRQDQSEFGWHDWVKYFHCTIVNQTTIEIEFS